MPDWMMMMPWLLTINTPELEKASLAGRPGSSSDDDTSAEFPKLAIGFAGCLEGQWLSLGQCATLNWDCWWERLEDSMPSCWRRTPLDGRTTGLRCLGSLVSFFYTWTNVLLLRGISVSIIMMTCARYLTRPFFIGCEIPEAAVKLIALSILCKLV